MNNQSNWREGTLKRNIDNPSDSAAESDLLIFHSMINGINHAHLYSLSVAFHYHKQSSFS
jgi:hypothetical protein